MIRLDDPWYDIEDALRRLERDENDMSRDEQIARHDRERERSDHSSASARRFARSLFAQHEAERRASAQERDCRSSLRLGSDDVTPLGSRRAPVSTSDGLGLDTEAA